MFERFDMNIEKKYKYFIWDFDGTLFDTYRFTYECIIKAFRDFEIEIDYSEVEKLENLSIRYMIGAMLEKFDLSTEIKEQINERYTFYKSQIENAKPFDNIINVLKLIDKNNGKNFIFSSSGKSIYNYLELYNIKNLFTDFIDRTMDLPKKPDPFALNSFIAKYNLNKQQMLYIGDKEKDILCAHNAGIDACLFGAKHCDEHFEYQILNYNNFQNKFIDMEKI